VWRAENTVDEELARALIGAQFPELALERVEPVAAGWDYTVFRVDDRWAFRFPRREVVLEPMARELDVLSRLEVPFAVPVPVYRGRPEDGYPWPFFGASWLEGTEATEAQDRSALAVPLARALRALHGAPGFDELPVDVSARADMTVRVPRTREQLGGLWWAPPRSVEELLDRAERLPPAGGEALCHGDLHFRQVIVDGGSLVGFVDWVDVCRADPGIDLQLAFAFLPPDARRAFFAAYGEVSDDSIVRARVVALSLGAMLARYGRDQGLPAIEREALASLDRAVADL
jgi:aminoglycoside phosphotransferase (APT) family kinase protein